MKKRIALDFEYRKTNETKFDLVCCALTNWDGSDRIEVWLHGYDKPKEYLKHQLLKYRDQGYLFHAWNVSAEARALISLGINPIKCKWFDLQAEYKMLLNHCDRFRYGKQFLDGKIVTTSRKDYEGPTRKGMRHDQPETNLLAATYKLLGIKGDKKHKDEMRDLIIHSEEFTKEQANQILEYCAGDIEDLFAMREKIIEAYKSLPIDWSTLNKDIQWRGETVARSAVIEATGYPVNPEQIKKFTDNVPSIIKDMQEDINSQFEVKPFRFIKRENRYSVFEKVQRDWIEQSEYKDKWPLTDKGKYSLGVEAYEKFFSYRHDYPRNYLPAQILRFRRLIQSLNGFKPRTKTTKTKPFTDHMDSNGRVHPYLNPFGSQTARYQPKASGFIPLKAAWMRSLIVPPEGKAICGIDYKSQEFLIAALLSNDENMIKAYESGDVYFYFAKLAKAVPWEAQRKDHELTRQRFKSTVLAIQYGMGKVSLAMKLTQDTGIKHTEEEAEDYISMFDEAFKAYVSFRSNVIFDYNIRNHLCLFDGWYMFGDNDNPRSVVNFPVQGTGSSILRRAIQLCQDNALKVIFPLHDALYIEYVEGSESTITLFEHCMRQAFMDVIDHPKAHLIELDKTIWTNKEPYIDERAKPDYERFSPYFI